MGDDADELPNKRDGAAGIENEDDIDEGNMFAFLMN
jgi:Ca2+-binding EF-hand superfamily protein